MKVFGVTGSIAAGKSAVTDLIKKHWPVIDADLVSREVVAPGQEGLARVVEAFGEKILTSKGTLNRSALRQIIAHSKECQLKLNSILHPIIISNIQERLKTMAANRVPIAFVSAALMLESGSYQNYKAGVILVSAPAEVRLKRLLERDGMTEETARNLMAKQMPDEEKRTYATAEIVNDGPLEELEARTFAALENLGIERAS